MFLFSWLPAVLGSHLRLSVALSIFLWPSTCSLFLPLSTTHSSVCSFGGMFLFSTPGGVFLYTALVATNRC